MFYPFGIIKKNLDRAVELAHLYPSDQTEGYFKSAEAFCKMMVWIYGLGAVGLVAFFVWLQFFSHN